MKKINYKKTLAFILSLFVLVMIPVLITYAQANQSPLTTIKNPLGDGNDSLVAILGNIMKVISTLGMLLVIIFIIYSGFKFVTAGSSDQDRSKAKDMFFYTIIGAAILLGANVIASIVVNTVEATLK